MPSYSWIHVKCADVEAVRAALHEPAELERQGRWVKVTLHRALALETFYADQDNFADIAQGLSQKLETPTLAALNFDDELLLLWAYDAGRLAFQYDSNPMVLGCPICSYSEQTIPAELGDVGALAALVGRPEEARELKSWLVRRRGLGFLSETQRHARLLELLGLTNPEVPVAVT